MKDFFDKSWDIVLGTVGAGVTLTAEKCIALTIGALTVGILLIRIRKEWRHKDE